MNKICKLSAIALLASSTSLMAQSKSFEGVSLGLTVSGIGAEVSGSSTQAGKTPNTGNGNSANGSLGKVTEIAAIDLSYGYAIGNNGIIQVGASYTPGKAKAGSGTYTDGVTNAGANLNAGTGNLSLEVKDPYTIYIAPTYVVSKDSAIYAKIGYAKAEINTSATGGATLSQKPGDLEGISYGIGSKTMLTQNLYLGVEANITDYDAISATTQTNAGNGGTASKRVTADVQTVQGMVTLGYKF
jgi:hypothetical protein